MAFKLPKPRQLTEHEITLEYIESLEIKIDKQTKIINVMMEKIDKLTSVNSIAPNSGLVEIEHQKNCNHQEFND